MFCIANRPNARIPEMPWIVKDDVDGFTFGRYATAEEAVSVADRENARQYPVVVTDPADLPIVADDVAYDSEGVGGLAWDCPECGVGGTDKGGETEHNRYAHRAIVTLADGVYYLTPASEWGGFEDLAQRAAFQYPGLTFAMACKCDRYDGWNDETRVHQYGCGETFTVGDPVV